MKAASKKERAASWGADGNDRERAVKEGRTGKPGLSNHSCGHLLMTLWWRRLPALGSNKKGSGFLFLEAQPPPCFEKPHPNHCVSDLTSFHKQILFLLKLARVGSDVWYWPWPMYLILWLYPAWDSTLKKNKKGMWEGRFGIIWSKLPPVEESPPVLSDFCLNIPCDCDGEIATWWRHSKSNITPPTESALLHLPPESLSSVPRSHTPLV